MWYRVEGVSRQESRGMRARDVRMCSWEGGGEANEVVKLQSSDGPLGSSTYLWGTGEDSAN